jgi:Mrp family chromosome partitioning ATPase
MKSQDSFGVIRATLEAEIAAPGVLAISSALQGDGKTAVTAGIARTLAAAGYRTLAIDAGGQTEESLCAKLGVSPSPPVSAATSAEHLRDAVRMAFAGCDVLSLSDISDVGGPSAVAIAALYAAIRADYDYAIVDARAISDGGATFARCADGVVLAVREGRSAEVADTEAVALLERIRARFLGVVATAGSARGTTRYPHTAESAGLVNPGRLLEGVRARLSDMFSSAREARGSAVGSTTPD